MDILTTSAQDAIKVAVEALVEAEATYWSRYEDAAVTLKDEDKVALYKAEFIRRRRRDELLSLVDSVSKAKLSTSPFGEPSLQGVMEGSMG